MSKSGGDLGLKCPQHGEFTIPDTAVGRDVIANIAWSHRNCVAPGTDSDPVDHPRHYGAHPSGVECITVVEHFGFNVGNAVKYLWRADEKENALEDLRKAAWYVNREIARRTAE